MCAAVVICTFIIQHFEWYSGISGKYSAAELNVTVLIDPCIGVLGIGDTVSTSEKHEFPMLGIHSIRKRASCHCCHNLCVALILDSHESGQNDSALSINVSR